MKKISSEDLGQKTKESLIWNISLSGVFQIVRFAISIVIARILDPKDFGIMGISSILIFYANSLSTFGFITALVQKKEISLKHINSLFTIDLGVSVFLTLSTCILAVPVAHFFNTPELRNVFWVLSSVFMITAFYDTPAALLRRDLSFKLHAKIDLVRGIVQSLSTLLLAYLGFAYWSLVIGLVLANLSGSIIINYRSAWIPKIQYDSKAVKEMFNFASWNFVAAQVRLLNDYIDKFIIGKFLGPITLGFYEKSFGVAFMPVENVAYKIGGVMFSTFSRSQTDKKQLENYLGKSIITISVCCFPIFIGLVSVAPYFVVPLFGEKWAPMLPSFKILLIAFLVSSLSYIINTFNIATGRHREQIIRRACCLIFLVVPCLLVVKLGIEMVAIVVLGYQILFLFVSFQLTREKISVTWSRFLYWLSPAFSGSIIMFFAVTFSANSFFSKVNLTNLILLVTLGGLIYTAWLLLINFPQSKFLKDEVLARIKKIIPIK